MFAWITWDPHRELFTIPFIDRPIGWYGVLFALGFLFGYYLILYFFRRFLCAYPYFVKGDVDWDVLILTIQKKEDNLQTKVIRELFFKLDLNVQRALMRLSENGKISEETKENVIQTLNRLLEDESYFRSIEFTAERQRECVRKLVHFAEKKLPLKTMILLKRRFLLESAFPQGFIPLMRRGSVFCEKIALYVMIGTVIGARLGHLLFYENWSYWMHDPWVIIRTWEGGLASHGGIAGILIALTVFYYRIRKDYPMITWLRLVDFLVVPSTLAAVFIRIGNFFNQEILGKASMAPWSIIFMHPADGSPVLPRHPAQLYEALFYLVAFGGFFLIWRSKMYSWKMGRMSGLFFVTLFSFRFVIEFFKEEQSYFIKSHSLFLMGQYLSIPLILWGIFLLFRFEKSKPI